MIKGSLNPVFSMRKIWGISLLFLGALLIQSCGGDLDKARMVNKVSAPDSSVNLLIYESNYGATVPYVYNFYLVAGGSEGKPTDRETDFLRVDDIEGINVSWLTPSNLLITCIRGNVYKYQSIGDTSVGRIRVDIATKC